MGKDTSSVSIGPPRSINREMVWVVRIQFSNVFRYSFNKHVPSSSCVPSLRAYMVSLGRGQSADLPSRTVGHYFSVSMINPSHRPLSVGPWAAHRPVTPGGKNSCPLLQMREARWPLSDSDASVPEHRSGCLFIAYRGLRVLPAPIRGSCGGRLEAEREREAPRPPGPAPACGLRGSSGETDPVAPQARWSLGPFPPPFSESEKLDP